MHLSSLKLNLYLYGFLSYPVYRWNITCSWAGWGECSVRVSWHHTDGSSVGNPPGSAEPCVGSRGRSAQGCTWGFATWGFTVRGFATQCPASAGTFLPSANGQSPCPHGHAPEQELEPLPSTLWVPASCQLCPFLSLPLFITLVSAHETVEPTDYFEAQGFSFH